MGRLEAEASSSPSGQEGGQGKTSVREAWDSAVIYRLRCWSRGRGRGPEGRREGKAKAGGGRKRAMRAGRKGEDGQVTAGPDGLVQEPRFLPYYPGCSQKHCGDFSALSPHQVGTASALSSALIW